MSRTWPSPPRTTGMMSASQAILRMVAAVTGPVNSSVPVPVWFRCRAVRCWQWRLFGGSRPEPGEQVPVIDGGHDLRAGARRRRAALRWRGPPCTRRPGRRAASAAGSGGPGTAARRPLRRGRAHQPGRAHPSAASDPSPGPACAVWPVAVPWPVSGPVRGLVAVFITVIRCSNWSVVAKISRCCRPCRGLRRKAPWSWRSSSSEGSAPSWSSASAQLRADPGQEVGVVLGRGAGQGVLHRRRGLREAGVPDPVQGERDDGRGPGRDLAGRDGGPELRVHGRHGPAGESLPGQQRVGQAEPAPGLRGADPQPRPQELHRVPVPVIQHRFRHRRLTPFRGFRRAPPQRTCRREPRTRSRAAGRLRGRQEAPAGSAVPGAPVCHPAGLSRQPVVHAVTAPAATPVAAAADCFRVRSTAAAATSCRYSTARETSSTCPAKSDAARNPHDPASSTAVEPTARSAARAASRPDCPTGAAPRSVPCASSPQAVKSLMKSLTASMARVYLRAPTILGGHHA